MTPKMEIAHSIWNLKIWRDKVTKMMRKILSTMTMMRIKLTTRSHQVTQNSRLKTPHNPSSKLTSINNKLIKKSILWPNIIVKKMRYCNGWQNTQEKNGPILNSLVQSNNSMKMKQMSQNGQLLWKISNGKDLRMSSKILNLWLLMRIKMERLLMSTSSMVLLLKIGLWEHCQLSVQDFITYKSLLSKSSILREDLFLSNFSRTASGYKSLSTHYCPTIRNKTVETAFTAHVTTLNSFGSHWSRKHM